MINNVTVGVVEKESYTLANKSEAFLGCIESPLRVYVKLNNKINKDRIIMHYNCAF